MFVNGPELPTEEWRGPSVRASQGAMMLFRTALAGALLWLPAAAHARGTVVHAGGSWAAIDRGGLCEALSRSLRIAAKGKVQATAGFSFTPDRRRWGEFHARLRRVARPGSSVMLVVGSQPFLLVSRGDQAWSRGPAQEQAIIAAARLEPGTLELGADRVPGETDELDLAIGTRGCRARDGHGIDGAGNRHQGGIGTHGRRAM